MNSIRRLTNRINRFIVGIALSINCINRLLVHGIELLLVVGLLMAFIG